MNLENHNRFDDFFREDRYVILKNYLYNYQLRKRAIDKCLQQELPELILEVGSGISPVVTKYHCTVYSDLSHKAVKLLKAIQKTGYYVVADGMHLPFKPNAFSHVICSEVLEHLRNDLQALKQMAQVLNQVNGVLIITVPHRKRYFANDDDFVKHYRRYELSEINERLKTSGLNPVQTLKVLGPLEKATMILVVYLITVLENRNTRKKLKTKNPHAGIKALWGWLFAWANLFYKGYVWLDAAVMPRSLASVILIKSIPAKKGI